jgi:hypothetical protein
MFYLVNISNMMPGSKGKPFTDAIFNLADALSN